MKTLSIIFILIFSFSVFGQSGTGGIYGETRSKEPVIVDRSKQEIKAAKEAEKRARKEKMKRPANIQINAPIGKVTPLIVQGLIEMNYALEDESAHRIVASRKLEGFAENLAGQLSVQTKYGSAPRMFISATVNEVSGVTTVVLSIGLGAENAFGKSNTASLDKNKKVRADLDSFLERLKYRAEN